MGDGGGCPEIDSDGQERFDCVECGAQLPARAPSAICQRCRNEYANMDPEERDYADYMREQDDNYR
jgi:hypothetical protein